jgi:hypothetical protein
MLKNAGGEEGDEKYYEERAGAGIVHLFHQISEIKQFAKEANERPQRHNITRCNAPTIFLICMQTTGAGGIHWNRHVTLLRKEQIALPQAQERTNRP